MPARWGAACRRETEGYPLRNMGPWVIGAPDVFFLPFPLTLWLPLSSGVSAPVCSAYDLSRNALNHSRMPAARQASAHRPPMGFQALQPCEAGVTSLFVGEA